MPRDELEELKLEGEEEEDGGGGSNGLATEKEEEAGEEEEELWTPEGDGERALDRVCRV